MILDAVEYFYIIAKYIGNDWKRLAALLYPRLNVDVIETEYPHSVFDRAIKFLNSWYRYSYPNVSLDLLIDALKEIDRNDTVTKINDAKIAKKCQK